MPGSFLDGRKSSSNPPEKMKFGQTCKMLSQYLKEKGSMRNLDFGINAKLEASSSSGGLESSQAATTTLNFLTDTEKSGTKVPDGIIKCLSHSAPALTSVEDAIKNTTTSEKDEMEAKAAQMTIFYAGQVLVVDNFSAANAKEVMLLASEGTNSSVDKMVEHFGNVTSSASASIQAEVENQSRKQLVNSNSDLPIARRASLHRFLEKRKDRATARAPYQLNNPTGESSKGHFDLNL